MKGVVKNEESTPSGNGNHTNLIRNMADIIQSKYWMRDCGSTNLYCRSDLLDYIIS